MASGRRLFASERYCVRYGCYAHMTKLSGFCLKGSRYLAIGIKTHDNSVEQ